MKSRSKKGGKFIILFFCLFVINNALAASPSEGLLKAKEQAEARGYIFEKSRDTIIDKAKKEGKLRALISLDPPTISSLAQAFREKYPFLEVHVQETTGRETSERFLLELQSGRATNWDVSHLSLDAYADYLRHGKRVDLLAMAEQGVLAIPPKMIDPNNRNVIAAASLVGVVGFNQCILQPSKVPQDWEDFLKPELKGRKFIADVRPLNYAAMAAGAGEEWMVRYAKRIAAQGPVWFRGTARATIAMIAGEYALHSSTTYNSIVGAADKDPRGCLQAKLVEPVPVRLGEPQMVLEESVNPNAGVLWLEFMASPTAQRIIDQKEPYKSSIYAPGAALEKIIRGKKTWVLGWNHFEKSPKWIQMAIEAFGFPQAESK